MQREREAHAVAVVHRHQQTREVLDTLRALWPEVFGAPVPLAIGIAHEIRQALGETRIPTAWLSQALHFRTHGSGVSDRGGSRA